MTEATVGQWFKKPGDAVKADEPLVELETDKVTVEVPAPAAGVLAEIKVEQGTTVAVGAVLGAVKEGAGAQAAAAAPAPAKKEPEKQPPVPEPVAKKGEMPPSPAARKALAESQIEVGDVEGSGRRGQVLKPDVADAIAKREAVPQRQSTQASYVPAPMPTVSQQLRVPSAPPDAEREERVKMTRLRQTIARRLKDAQNTAAMLTTFNDVDMSAVMAMRSQYKDLFEKRHGVRLGFMGFFVKACLTRRSRRSRR